MANKSRGFGSFHSDNVEDMIRSSEWKAPPLPFVTEDYDRGEKHDDTEFGRKYLLKHYLLDPDWTFVNHGAFGAPLRVAYELADKWRRHAELQPLRFIDRQLFPHLVQVVLPLNVHTNLC